MLGNDPSTVVRARYSFDSLSAASTKYIFSDLGSFFVGSANNADTRRWSFGASTTNTRKAAKSTLGTSASGTDPALCRLMVMGLFSTTVLMLPPAKRTPHARVGSPAAAGRCRARARARVRPVQG